LWQSASISSSIIHNEQLYKLQLHINYGFQAWSCKSYALHWEFPTTTMLQGQSWTILFQAKWFSSYLDFRVNCPPFAAWRRTKIGQNISYCRITWLPLYLWFWHFLFLYATIYSSTSSVHVFSSRQKKNTKTERKRKLEKPRVSHKGADSMVLELVSSVTINITLDFTTCCKASLQDHLGSLRAHIESRHVRRA
jgi:hypothetical protein